MATCVHGVKRHLPGHEGACDSCDRDRDDMPLDRCQHCNRLGTWGIRSHPKYSVKVGVIIPDGYAGLIAYYAPDPESLGVLVDIFKESKGVDIIATEFFDGREWKEITV